MGFESLVLVLCSKESDQSVQIDFGRCRCSEDVLGGIHRKSSNCHQLKASDEVPYKAAHQGMHRVPNYMSASIPVHIPYLFFLALDSILLLNYWCNRLIHQGACS